MNMFIRELKTSVKSLLIWSLIILILCATGFAKFAAYQDAPELLEVLDNMPPAMLEAFQMNAFNLTELSGFFGVLYNYFALMFAISAAMWGSDIITKEERDKTVEFSLTLPVSRREVVTAKTAASVVKCIAFALITWVIVYITTAQYSPDAAYYEFVAMSMLSLFILQMVFLSVGILLACIMKQHKRVSSVAISIILGTYFLSILSGLSEDVEFLEYFTPFKYFNAALILNEARFETTFVLLSLAIIVVSMVGAFMTYERRDLYI